MLFGIHPRPPRAVPFLPVSMSSAMERTRIDIASEEKVIGDETAETAKHIHTIENLPDPDAGLSEEERAAHVCCLLFAFKSALVFVSARLTQEARTKCSSAN